MEIVLHRMYLPEATHGLLQLGDYRISFTLELPWVSNQRSISCIPEGRYELRRRYSPRFKEHFEVVDVPDRTAILIHPANNAQRELRGCIAPVSQLLAPGWGDRSRIAMSKFKHLLQAVIIQEGAHLNIQKATDPQIIQILKTGKL